MNLIVLQSMTSAVGSPPELIALLVAFGLFAWVTYSYPVRWKKTIQAAFNERLTKQLMREEALLAHRSSAVVLLLFCLALALCIGSAMRWPIGAEGMDSSGLAMIAGAILLFSLFHWGAHALAGVITCRAEEIEEYVYVISLLHKVATPILLSLSVGALFGVDILSRICVVGMAVIVIAMLGYRLVRGTRIAYRSHITPFYFVLYLCALEILPFLLILKGMQEVVSS